MPNIFIGAAGAFTLYQKQIDIKLIPPAPTQLVHICIGYCVGFMYAELMVPGPNNQMFAIPTAAVPHVRAWDYGSSTAAPQPQPVQLQGFFMVVPGTNIQVQGYVIVVLRRLKVTTVPPGANFIYRKYLPRRTPTQPMTIPDPNAQPLPFSILEYGGQIQSWRKIHA